MIIISRKYALVRTGIFIVSAIIALLIVKSCYAQQLTELESLLIQQKQFIAEIKLREELILKTEGAINYITQKKIRKIKAEKVRKQEIKELNEKILKAPPDTEEVK